MEFDDDDIRRILSDEDRREASPTVPSWKQMSAGVRKQNFLTFGFLHLNIYYALLLLTFSGTAGTYFIMPYFSKGSTHSKKDTRIEQTIVLPETADQSSTIRVPAEPEQKTIDDQINITEITEPIPKKRLPKQQKSQRFPEPKREVTEVVLTDSVKEPIPKADVVLSRRKARKIIVFETDTVVKYDTLVVNKKTRKRD